VLEHHSAISIPREVTRLSTARAPINT